MYFIFIKTTVTNAQFFRFIHHTLKKETKKKTEQMDEQIFIRCGCVFFVLFFIKFLFLSVVVLLLTKLNETTALNSFTAVFICLLCFFIVFGFCFYCLVHVLMLLF